MLPAYNADKNINYYKAIFDNSLTAIFTTIPDGTIIDANQAAVDIFGYTVEEMRTLGRMPLFDDTDPGMMELLKTREREGVARGEATGIRKNGRRFPCEIASAVFTDENHLERSIVSLVDISERKAIEKDLFSRQQLLNAVVNNSNEGMAVTDRDGHFLIFNEVMADLLGVAPVDSKTYDWAKKFNIYHRDGNSLVPTKKLPIVRALNGERIKDEIYLIKNPQKGNVYLSISASPIKNETGDIIGSLVVDRDITNQFIYQENLRQANEELTNAMNSLLVSNERFKYVAKATNDAIWDMDLNTYSIKWGEGYEKLFGYKTDNEGTYNDWQSKIHPDDREWVTKSIQKMVAEKRSNIWEAEYRYLKSDGTMADVFDRGYVIYSGDNVPVRMIGALQDITHRKQYEVERTQLIDDLLQQNKNLEQFTYIISHNLRSPVANIIGCAEMLKDEDLTKDEKNSLVNGLAVSINKLDNVIKDLHTILQLKNDINGGNRETVSLVEIFNDVKISLNNLIAQSNAVIKVNFEVTEVNFVKSFIYSIFLNLISNSIKYRNENIPPLIEIASYRRGDKLYITFKDNGLGIDLAAKGQDLFGLYKRFHSHVEGKGLGLFMVKTQIESMKGKISVTSNVLEGTEFKIVLPVN